MRIEQAAGRSKIEVYTDGSPLWPDIAITATNGERHCIRASMADLHDLRYCIDRLLAQIPTERT